MVAYVKDSFVVRYVIHYVIAPILKIIRSAPFFIIFCLAITTAELFLFNVLTDVTGEPFDKTNLMHLVFFDSYTIVFFLLLPVLFSVLLLKVSLQELNLRAPKNKALAAVYAFLVLLIVLPVSYYLFMHNQPIRIAYAIPKTFSIFGFAFLQIIILPIYYFCEEFFFRGFYFMYLWKKIGWHSYWVTELTFMFAHIGKPPLEILVSFPIGILLNFLTLKTKSIYPAVAVHLIVGMFFNVLGYIA